MSDQQALIVASQPSPHALSTASYTPIYGQPGFLQFIDSCAEWVVVGKIGGCKNIADAKSLLMISYRTGQDIHQIAARNHIIGGKLSKRPESMLADFNAAGGLHEWIDFGDDGKKATIKLEAGGRSLAASFTIEEAMRRDLVPPENEKGREKHQWVKMPGEMLRARAISKAMRAFRPQFCDGLYTPEELMDEAGSYDNEPPTASRRAESMLNPGKPAGSAKSAATTKTTSPTQQAQQAPQDDVIDAEYTVSDKPDAEEAPFDTGEPTAEQRVEGFKEDTAVLSLVETIKAGIGSLSEANGRPKPDFSIFEQSMIAKGKIPAPFVQCDLALLQAFNADIQAKLAAIAKN